MSTTAIDREAIEERLEELRGYQDEANRLSRILEVWDEPKGGKPRRTSSTASGRASRGSRPQQFVEMVQDTPGISANEIATEIGCNLNYVYRLAKDLAKDKKVVKRGRGYFPFGLEPEDQGPEPDPEPSEAELVH